MKPEAMRRTLKSQPSQYRFEVSNLADDATTSEGGGRLLIPGIPSGRANSHANKIDPIEMTASSRLMFQRAAIQRPMRLPNPPRGAGDPGNNDANVIYANSRS